MPDIFDQIEESNAPGDVFDQITEDDVAKASSAPSAQTVEGALKSVPRPSLPITDEPSHGLYETFEQAKNRPAETPHVPLPAPTAKDIAAGVINAATDPMMGGAQAEPRPGTEAVQGASELVTPGKRLGGAAKLVNAAGEIASPVMGVGALEAPVSSLVGLGTGLAASKGARAVTKSAGGGEGAQDLAESLGFWIPSLTGAVLRPKVGVAITPEEVRVGAAIHPPGTDPMAATASFPRGGYKTEPPANGLEPPTIEGNPQSVTTPEEVQTAAASMARAQQSEVAAQKMVRGIPSEPPPAPPESHPEITPEAVEQVGEHIESLPKEQQAHAIVAAHTALAKGLLEQGKVVTPDGNIHVVRTEGQAESLAGKIINEEVSRRADEEDKPAKTKTADVSGAAPIYEQHYSGPVDIQSVEAIKNNRDLPANVRDDARAVFEAAVDSGMPIHDAMQLNGTDRLANALGGRLEKTLNGSGQLKPLESDAFDKIAESDVPKDAFDQITGTLEKGTRVQLEGAPATVRHMSDAAGISVLRVEFDQPTTVPWSAKPVTKTSVPVKYQDKLQTLKGAESTNAVPESSVPVSSPASTGEGTKVKPKSEWQQLYDKAVAAQPDKESALRKMSGEQLRAALAAPKTERRADSAERRRVAEMSPEEMKRELLTSLVTGIPNKRAFTEAGHSPAVAMSDADGLKALNDKFGYEAGNALLKAKAEAIQEAGLDAYHEKGDEFLYRGASPEELSSKLEKARAILRNREITATMVDGSVKRFKGADFSHGSGKDIAEAEAGLKAHKSEREARGERARGELRGIAEVGPEKGEVSKGGTEEEVAEPESLLTGESGYFEPGKIGEAATAEYQKEIKPALDKAGLTLGEALDELTHLIAPRAGIPIKTLDSAMKLTGVREQNRFVLEQTLAKAQTLFDKMPREAQVAFVDNYKQGAKQATPQLQQISDFMGKADDATYRAVVEAQVGNLSSKAQSLWKSMSDGDKYSFVRKLSDFKGDETLPNGPLKELANGLLTFKDDHYRVLWKVVPGKAEAKGSGSVRSVRPLEGSKGFLKQSTLATMSEGLERGGEPVDYNPVRMFQLSQADSWRYITAQRMWQDALTDGGRVFVKQGSQLPDGFRFVSDRIGNVRFQSDAGMVQAGQWAVREDWHRLLSNMLSHDYIRESTIGNGLMSVKNNLTAFRLSLSPFHALTTTVSSWANAVGRGLQNVNYAARNASLTALVEGAKDIATTPIAPIMDYRLGTSVVRYVTNPEEFVRSQRGLDFIKRYPEAAQLVDDLFSAGAKLSLHEDERLHGIEGLRQAVAENHYIAALLKTPVALNQQVMRPLFGYYVPRIKLATFLKDHSFELTDRGADISSGIKSRGEVARKTWDTTENIYGQMNWDARWWNRTLKSSIQLAFRAFTWFSGNVRLVKDAGIGQSKEAWESARWWNERLGGDSEPLPSSGPIPRIDPAFAKILGLGLVYMAANAALQYSMTREKPKDARDLFAARIGGVDAYGKPLRVVAPAIVLKDAMSLWGHGPWSYMRSKESDLISGISEVVNNEDFRHAMIHNPEDKWWKQRYDDAAHVLGSPIGISNFQREKQYGESKAKAVLGAVGFSPAPAWISQTPIEKKIAEMQAANPGGPMAPEARAHIDLEHSVLGALRNGDSAPLEKAIEDGKLKRKDAKTLRHRARLNPLEDRIRGLEFMKSDKQVYSQLFQLSQTKGISEEESRVLNRMMAKKRATMFKKGEGKEVAEAEE